MNRGSGRSLQAVRWATGFLIAAGSFGLTTSADVSTSEPVARELGRLMVQQKLPAFAAKDPRAANTFVAAMLFPNVQLLVVAGEPVAPAATQAQIDQKQYNDVYLTLQQAVNPNSKIFFQDLKADGLHAKAADAMDIVYEHVSAQTMFDGQPAKHKLTEAQYSQKFAEADAAYARLLQVLVDSLKQHAASTNAGQ